MGCTVVSSGQQEIAQSIRAMLAQHRDVFSVIDPRETRQQILARLPDQGGECREYLARIERRVNSDQLLAPRNVRLLRDDANVMTFRGHSGGVMHVAALPDGRALSASDDNTLRLWDLASGECLRVLEGHSGPVTHVAALAGGCALSASDDRHLRLWDLVSGECLRVLEGHSRRVNHVAALPGARALSASDDRHLRLWDLASGECLRVLEGH